MQDQHKKISGYRDLTQEEIDLMNRIKAFGPELDELCKDVCDYLVRQDYNAMSSDTEIARLDAADPLGWMHEGKTSLQKGLMFLTRSVAQPTFF